MIPLTLHIGMNKTGTTALQRSLFQNRAVLARAGLLYPKTGLGTRIAGSGLHYRLSKAFQKGGKGGPEMVEKLLSEIDGSGAKAAIVSSEFFVEVVDVATLAQCIGDRPVRILVYLRRHDRWVSSLFSQAIKTQASPPWAPNVEAFTDHIRRNLAHYYVYSRLLDRWAGAFGTSSVEVRLYDTGGDIVAGILGDYGIDPGSLGGFTRPAERVNSSPSRRQLAAIDHIQRASYPPAVKTLLVRRILANDDQDRPRQLMTRATAQALLAEHAEDYADIARRYLGREDGVLFDTDLPDEGGPDRIALWPGEGITILGELLAEAV